MPAGARSALLSLLVASVFAVAGPASAAGKPVINSAAVNDAATQLTLSGNNMDGVKNVKVLVSGYPTALGILTLTPTSIIAVLPAGLLPGTYAVTVGNGNGAD